MNAMHWWAGASFNGRGTAQPGGDGCDCHQDEDALLACRRGDCREQAARQRARDMEECREAEERAVTP